MCFPREDNLDGALRIAEQSLQSSRVAEKECRTLVGSESSREANRERLGVEQPSRRFHRSYALSEPNSLQGHTLACIGDEIRLQLTMRLPELPIRYVADASPRGRLVQLRIPVVT